jgi:serine/threonine-protein kinase
MSRKREPAPAPEASAGDLLPELEQVRREKDAGQRNLAAWRLVTSAYGRKDWYAVVDYAMENGLVEPLVSSAAGDGKGRRALAAPQTWTNPIDGSEMIYIPPGPFYVGAKKRPAVSGGFSLARHPVTDAQFRRFLDETSYTPPAEHPDPETFLSHWSRLRSFENHPVVWVSFADALAYCRWAGLALPTEWLWEKAARGPDGRSYPWGEESPFVSRTEKLANLNSAKTCRVGSYPRTRTAYGCEDMVGNVSEWCQMGGEDDFGAIPQTWPDVSPKPNPPPIYAAVRGSCFLRTDHLRMRSWHRRQLSIYRRNQWVGFRPACYLPCAPAR